MVKLFDTDSDTSFSRKRNLAFTVLFLQSSYEGFAHGIGVFFSKSLQPGRKCRGHCRHIIPHPLGRRYQPGFGDAVDDHVTKVCRHHFRAKSLRIEKFLPGWGLGGWRKIRHADLHGGDQIPPHHPFPGHDRGPPAGFEYPVEFPESARAVGGKNEPEYGKRSIEGVIGQV